MLASPVRRREPAHDQGIQDIAEMGAVALTIRPLWIRQINEIVLPAIRGMDEEQPVTVDAYYGNVRLFSLARFLHASSLSRPLAHRLRRAQASIEYRSTSCTKLRCSGSSFGWANHAIHGLPIVQFFE
jgi:hypothetical protein